MSERKEFYWDHTTFGLRQGEHGEPTNPSFETIEAEVLTPEATTGSPTEEYAETREQKAERLATVGLRGGRLAADGSRPDVQTARRMVAAALGESS